MSGNRKQNNASGNSAILSTIAAVGIGAIAAAGAYFVGKAIGEEETEARVKAQQHFQQQRAGQAHVRHVPPRTPDTDEYTDDEDEDPKSVLEKECIICACKFEALKRQDAEIHTTPCGHLFCGNCIKRCLQRRQECPTCKQPVAQGQTLRIFL